MRSINSTFKAEKNKASNRPIFLYTIYAYDGSNNLYFAEYDIDVVFDDITYTKFPIKHDYISENINGQIDSIKISVSNVSREIQGYLETNDLRGKKVKITMVWANQLSDVNAKIDDIYYIDTITANQAVAEFTLTSKFDVLNVDLPGRRYSRNYCAWKFKSTECGYGGAETSCNKTFQRCRDLSNQERFGGFPAIPMRKVMGL
jgi:lambda family phage minor tail protein L